jgi:hypothetical protein
MSGTEAHEQAPFIDYENLPAPTDGIVVTQFITVRSVRSRAFYSEVLGGQVVLEENPCIVKLANSWDEACRRRPRIWRGGNMSAVRGAQGVRRGRWQALRGGSARRGDRPAR